MKTSSLYMEHLRRKAENHLPRDFARRVVEDSRQGRRAAGQLRVIAITGTLCVIAAVSFHLIESRITQERNLQAWTETADQIQVLEESI